MALMALTLFVHNFFEGGLTVHVDIVVVLILSLIAGRYRCLFKDICNNFS